MPDDWATDTVVGLVVALSVGFWPTRVREGDGEQPFIIEPVDRLAGDVAEVNRSNLRSAQLRPPPWFPFHCDGPAGQVQLAGELRIDDEARPRSAPASQRDP